jgi:TM2 domain-containing membrane protein YozV
MDRTDLDGRDVIAQELPPLPPPSPRTPQSPLVKSPGLALVLSAVFPGIGQVYNGQPAKAFVFFFGFVGSIYGVADISPFPFAFLIPFVYFFNIIDAYRSATLLNARAAGGALPEEDVVESPAWGFSLIALGVLLLLNNIGWLNLAALQRYWPVLLVAAGAVFVWGSFQKKAKDGGHDPRI